MIHLHAGAKTKSTPEATTSFRLLFAVLRGTRWMGWPFSIWQLLRKGAVKCSQLSLFAQNELWFWFTAYSFYDPVPGNRNNCHLAATLCLPTWRDVRRRGSIEGTKGSGRQCVSAACLAAF